MLQAPGAEPIPPPAPAPTDGDHRALIYDTDARLTEAVVEFLRPALAGGVIAIAATPHHRGALTRAMAAAGADARALARQGRLVLLDVGEALERLMVDDRPSRAAFHDATGGAVDDTARRGSPVRMYSEMGALLWQQGRVGAAMAVEGLWNELVVAHQIELLCGYPASLAAAPGAGLALESVCERHAAVTLPPDPSGIQPQADLGGLGGPGQRAVRWRFPASLASGGRARRNVRELLASWGITGPLDEAELLTTELVNNAVVHARSQVVVSVKARHGAVRVEVTDLSAGAVHRRHAGTSSADGRGLMLVEALSSSWGTVRSESSKTVWFELPSDMGEDRPA